MKTVHEVADISGVSVRTLHHYDAIGLLKPTKVTEAGYRLYDDAALKRLQSILLFRELQFPLKEIKRILDSPHFDEREAIRQQITMLRLQKERLEGLITFAENLERKGVHDMSFTAFDDRKLAEYAAEAKEKWGDTAAWQESERKLAGKSPAEEQSMADGLMEKFAELGAMGVVAPDSETAQSWVRDLQDYITANYYACTKEILSGLGQMYTADERFRANIDAAGGDGTAELAGKAIAVYCK